MNEIFSLIFNRLDEYLSVNVFDYVEQDFNSFPYVRVDALTNGAMNTDLENGFASQVQIIIFSQYRGNREVGEISKEIYDLLHRWDAPDTLSFGISNINQEFQSSALDSDGKTRIGIQRFNILFEPLPA